MLTMYRVPGTAKSKPSPPAPLAAAAAADSDEDDEAKVVTTSTKTSSITESCSGRNISADCDTGLSNRSLYRRSGLKTDVVTVDQVCRFTLYSYLSAYNNSRLSVIPYPALVDNNLTSTVSAGRRESLSIAEEFVVRERSRDWLTLAARGDRLNDCSSSTTRLYSKAILAQYSVLTLNAKS